MIDLPKKCKRTGKPMISYSQLSSFLKNKRDYFRKYFFNEPTEDNSYFEFGRRVGQALEKGDFSAFTNEEQEFLKTLPRYDEFEREILLDCGEFVVTGYIDSNASDLSKILDYKSGTAKKKEEYESPDYIQLLIYALAIKQETGRLPEKTTIILYDRIGNAFKGEELKLGNEFWEIDLPVTEERCEEVMEKLNATVKKISDYYSVFLKLNQLS